MPVILPVVKAAATILRSRAWSVPSRLIIDVGDGAAEFSRGAPGATAAALLNRRSDNTRRPRA